MMRRRGKLGATGVKVKLGGVGSCLPSGGAGAFLDACSVDVYVKSRISPDDM